ncbi:MAG: hypothetical protein ACR2JZ_01025 [Candidatus Limnocylindrales bacterium]
MRHEQPASVPLSARLGALLVALIATAGCAGTAPSPTAQDYQGLFEALALRGASVSNIVSGDPGCDDPGLAANSVRIRLRDPDDGAQRDAHLFVFKDRAFFEQAGPAVDACQEAFEVERGMADGQAQRLDVSPFRIFGTDWSPALREAVGEALIGSAGIGS